MKTILFTCLVLSAIAPNAQAHRDGDTYNYYEINKRYVYFQRTRCVTEYRTLLSSVDRVSKACAIRQPLRLAWTTQTYPNLRENPRRVQFWEGSYVKEIATDLTILRELVDDCRGRILSQNTIVETVNQHEESFPVTNPNLDVTIKESFMLVPMTEEEARQELTEAAVRCQK